MGVTLRPATLADAPLLRRWEREPHLIATLGDDDWQWETELGRDLPWRASLIAEVGGHPIGFLEIIDPAADEEQYWGDCGPGLRAVDIWVGDPGSLGRGLGTEMMTLALDRCFAAPDVTAVVIDPLFGNVAARRFYERLGFAFVERRWFGDDDTAVYRLERAVWAECRARLTPAP